MSRRPSFTLEDRFCGFGKADFDRGAVWRQKEAFRAVAFHEEVQERSDPDVEGRPGGRNKSYAVGHVRSRVRVLSCFVELFRGEEKRGSPEGRPVLEEFGAGHDARFEEFGLQSASESRSCDQGGLKVEFRFSFHYGPVTSTFDAQR